MTRSLLDEILEPDGLSVAFQPVVSVKAGRPEIHSLEGLVRGPKGSAAEDPEILFDYVRRKKEENAVDRVCVARILREARRLPREILVSVNVHASTLGRDPEFLTFLGDTLDTCGIAPSRLIVEVVEYDTPWGRPLFLHATSGLRDIGIGIAVDDIGKGHSNYRMLLDVRPDYFKLDRFFVRRVHADFYRQAILESVGALARKFGARVVAEGVETDAELEAVMAMGIGLIQGHRFAAARPFADVRTSGFAEMRKVSSL